MAASGLLFVQTLSSSFPTANWNRVTKKASYEAFFSMLSAQGSRSERSSSSSGSMGCPSSSDDSDMAS